jgi:hypothetical protein
MEGVVIVDAWCGHMLNRHGLRGRQKCNRVATMHYRSNTGIEVRLCGAHAKLESHRWKNPIPINEVV